MPNVDDGIYAAYFSGKVSEAAALIVVREGLIVGIDPNGLKIDGRVVRSGLSATAEVRVRLPPGVEMVQGGKTDRETSYDAKFQYTGQLEKVPYIRVETALGPINARFDKLRGFDD